MRTLVSFILISSVSLLSACTLLVEVKDKPEDNVNNVNNANNAQCGNSRREGSEVCDGNDLGGTTCAALSLGDGTLSCYADCTFNTSECDSSSCGDGYVSAGEQCDGVNLDQKTCRSFGFDGGVLSCKSDCTFELSECQGTAVELCDDGVDNDRDGSTDCDDNDCTDDPACTTSNCGNGNVEGDEQCDGTNLANKTCNSLNYDGGTLACTGTCEYDLSGCTGSVCGDEWISGDEQCDGDNLQSTTCGDWGFYTGTLSCTATSCTLDFSGCTGNTELNSPMQVEAGDAHTCARISSSEILCWGSNEHGQIGIQSNQRFLPVPVRLSFGGNWLNGSDLAAGGRHTCVVGSGAGYNGQVLCWGDNSHSQLGDGTTTSSAVPILSDASLINITAVTAGDAHTCALAGDRKVWCWGSNTAGQLGLGPGYGLTQTTPVMVNSLQDIVAISAGANHTCAIREIDATTRQLYCWGDNSSNQLGLGTNYTGDTSSPVLVGFNARAVACGTAHTCAINDTDNLYCWGSNNDGQCGYSGTGSGIPLTLGFNAFRITAGAFHTCATQGAMGEVFCWGNNSRGQLGLGDTFQKSSPTRLSSLSDVTHISGGGEHTCAVGQRSNQAETDCTNGADDDSDGQTDCDDSDCYMIPACMGTENTMALCNDGNDNDLDGKFDCNDPDCFPFAICTSSENCTNVIDDDGDGLADCLDPICHNDPMCIMRPIQVKCWGGNWHAQLGNASTLDEYYPITVAGQ